jgi:3-hydroxyacyl-[acyl-carrier-protein] dehydratase
MDARACLSLLPWRHPFLMIDRMLESEPHRRIRTLKRITYDDPSLCPGDDGAVWFPSVLLLEGMAQSAALLFRMSYSDSSPETLPMLGFLQASWSGSARPGEDVIYDVTASKMTRSGGVFEGRAFRDDSVIAQAQLAFQETQHRVAGGANG